MDIFTPQGDDSSSVRSEEEYMLSVYNRPTDHSFLFPLRSNPRWRPAAILEILMGHPIHFIFVLR